MNKLHVIKMEIINESTKYIYIYMCVCVCVCVYF